MDAFLTDLRFSARLLRKSPGFAAIAIATLALGIGANTAMFSAVDAMLIRPLPYADPDRVVMVWEDAREAGFPRNTPAPGNYTEWVQLNRAFTAMAATRGATANLTGGAGPELVVGRAVTASFFEVLGVAPMLGRSFTDAEDRAGAPVVVVGYRLWQRRFGGDRSAIGQTMLMNGNRVEVIGVMPRGFVFRNRDVDYWVPIALTPALATLRSSHFLNVVARLAPGKTIDAAAADMRRVDEILQRQYPDTNRTVRTVLQSMEDDVLGNTRVQLLVLMAASAAVLLVACANLASLLLARASGRRGELAVRAALGATPGRLLGQMVVEALLLSAAGGALGLAVARVASSTIARLTPRGFEAHSASILDARLIGFSLALSLVTALVFAAVPALQAARASLQSTLQHSGPTGVGGRGRTTRDGLVVVQVAAALVLLVAAGLMLRTLANLRAIDIGFRADRLLTLRTALSPNRYRDAPVRLSFYDRVVADVRSLPGVESAAYGSTLPFASPGNTIWYSIERPPRLDPSDPMDALYRVGTGDYLKTLGAQLVAGRLLDDRDGAGAPMAVVINSTMARIHWPDRSPLGHRLRVNNADNPLHTIVGVVKDIRERGHELAMKPGVYFTVAQRPAVLPEYLVVRTSARAEDTADAVRKIVARVDPDQPVSAVRSMEEIIDTDVADRRQQMVLLGAFAAVALLLAAIGLYGVLSYAVTQRRREIGLRMALGASGRSVVRMVVGRGVVLTSVGLAIGLALAWVALRAMQTSLYGVTPGDPVTFGVVLLALSAIGVIASYLPARRAARVDPMVVLRSE